MSKQSVTMKRITIAFDSFKGSLTSREAAEAFAEGWHESLPECEVRKAYIADGGEGMTEAIAESLAGEYIEIDAHDPLGRPIRSRYALIHGDTAIVELAAAAGLTLVTAEERNPLITATYGVGEMIVDALRRGCRKVILGLGGSATNDGASGMLRALGYRFYSADKEELTTTIDILERVASVDDTKLLPMVRDIDLRVAVDVDNPLYGERGAAAIYAPQKGADAEMVERLDRALRHYASVVGEEFANVAGAGAAGGVGYGVLAMLGARPQSGIELVLDTIGFKEMVAGCDLVVTGEGRIDSQTLMGKAPSGVLRYAQTQGVPCIAVGGGVVWSEELRRGGFKNIYAATPHDMPLEEAMRSETAYRNLRNVAVRIAKELVATR